MTKTSSTGKTTQTREECSAEGCAIMLDQADKTIQSCADIVANLATIRQCARRIRVSRLSQANNPPTMPQITPTMTIVVECS